VDETYFQRPVPFRRAGAGIPDPHSWFLATIPRQNKTSAAQKPFDRQSNKNLAQTVGA
jgi:hypothetical protein